MYRLEVLLVLVAALAVRAGGNLVPNGDFADGLAHWKVTFPESNETKYSKNHQWVSIVDDGKGKAIQFTLNNAVAASEGVKACTELIEVDPTRDHEFGAEVFTEGPSLIVFVEGYQRDPERTEAGNDRYPGFVRVYRHKIIVRVKGNTWSPVSLVADLDKRPPNAPTHLLVKLYAYYPAGTCRFRNVFLRPVTGK